MEASGQSRYALSRQSGIAQSVLSRFAAGGRLELPNAERLADALDLELTVRPKSRRQSKGR